MMHVVSLGNMHTHKCTNITTSKDKWLNVLFLEASQNGYLEFYSAV